MVMDTPSIMLEEKAAAIASPSAKLWMASPIIIIITRGVNAEKDNVKLHDFFNDN